MKFLDYGDQMDGRVRRRSDMSNENRLSVTALDDASQPRSETPSPSVSREISDDESEFKNLSHANSPLLCKCSISVN